MLRTLIVEDNAVFRRSLSEVLQVHFPCMTVDEASDGAEALDKVSRLPPQLVFMDIKLPGANGLTLTRAIRDRHAGIVIAILTAYDIPEYRDAALASGADYFLPKGTATGDTIVALVEAAFPATCR